MGTDQLTIPVLDDAKAMPSVDRGSIFLSALAALDISVAGQRTVDLGAGFGSMAIASARAEAAEVYAVDVNSDRTSAIARRAAEAGVAVTPITANLLEPVGVSECDLAFLIGVVEYAGLWDTSRDVERLQVAVLGTARETLRPGGVLILGTKNRLWPRFTWSDVHTGQPFVNSLPRSLVARWTRRSSGGEYRHYIHSPRGWTRLLTAAGFSDVKVYFPYLSYQFPLVLTEKPHWSDLSKLWRLRQGSEVPEVAIGVKGLSKAALIAAGSAVGVPLSHSVFIIARR